MKTSRLAAASVATLLFSAVGCGSSGGITSRPVETLMYVRGAAGATFMFGQAGEEGCPASGSGIESPNASHQFGDRIFQANQLFVLENLRQPMRAVIRNLSMGQCQGGAQPGAACVRDDDCAPGTCLGAVPIEVLIYLGTNPRVSGGEGLILPGECRAIVTDRAAFTSNPSGAQTQIEVCSPLNTDGEPDLTIPCVESTGDRHLTYFATVGDVQNSNITNCLLSPFLAACQTPTTFFLEQPKDEVDAVMSLNSGQNPGTGPPAEIRLQLYINGLNVANDGGTNPVVSANL